VSFEICSAGGGRRAAGGRRAHAHQVADGVVLALDDEAARVLDLGVLLEGDPAAAGGAGVSGGQRRAAAGTGAGAPRSAALTF
jgi:hypothetical protein